MTASRVQALSARAPFRRGGLLFSAARLAVEIPADHPLVDVLAVLREPVLTIQVDSEGDGVFVTMKPEAREAAIAHVVAQLAAQAGGATQDNPEEPKPVAPAGDPAGGAGAPGNTTVAAPTPLEVAIDAVVQADAAVVAAVEPAPELAVNTVVATPENPTVETAIVAPTSTDAAPPAPVEPAPLATAAPQSEPNEPEPVQPPKAPKAQTSAKAPKAPKAPKAATPPASSATGQ